MDMYKNKNDLLSGDIVKFRKLERIFLERCRQFGYREIKTSTIEPLHIFTTAEALSPESLKRIYSFIDWGGWSGERVVLRPDSTVSTARYYLGHLNDEPLAKVCYVENHFFLDDTGQGVSERWQFGLETIGDDSSLSDVETVFIAFDTLHAAKLPKTFIHLSYPRIVKECIKHTFPEESDKQRALELIKTNRYEELQSLKTGENGLDTLLTLLHFKGKGASFLKNIKSSFSESDGIQQYLNRFIEVCLVLDRLNCSYEINFSLSKNFDYYTGIQFEILSRPQKRYARDVLCSGGRYNNLIGSLGKGDKETPSVGFAFYIKNIVALLHLSHDSLRHIAITMSNITHQNMNGARGLCNKLSNLGFVASITLNEIKREYREKYGLIIEVDYDKFRDGYAVIYSQDIGKSLLKQIFGESF